jgi:Rps23 Pro-64 3,4-dihydroxylase Tpa1-like proline 4-hydroxylase
MISIFNDLLSEEEITFLKNKCNNFVKNNLTIPDGLNHFYNSMHITDGLDSFKNKLIGIVDDTYEIQYNGIFINKIDTYSNQNDAYHRDECDLTFVTYLNEDFVGGDFEYIKKGEKEQIKPKTNLSIMMYKNILHRVLPVTEGERYSLVTWFRLVKKNII